MRIHPVFLALPVAALAATFLVSAHTPPPRLDRALEAQRALALERPGDAGVHNDLGNLLELAGDRLGAEEAYLRAIELAPDDPGPRFNRGLLLVSIGRRREALGEFRKVVDLDPGHAWAHYEIGAIWDAWGIDRLARRAYARAFELDFQLADPRVNPDVLDNREATAAMLLAWRRGTPAAGVPRDYADAGRIASLLIEAPRPAREETEEAGELDEGDAGGGFARLTSPPLAAPPSGSGGAADDDRWLEEPAATASDAEPRVLDSSDLGSGRRSVNQISTPGGATGPRTVVPRGSRDRGSTYRGRSVAPRTRYGSTGRLEPVLRPVDASRHVIAG